MGWHEAQNPWDTVISEYEAGCVWKMRPTVEGGSFIDGVFKNFDANRETVQAAPHPGIRSLVTWLLEGN